MPRILVNKGMKKEAHECKCFSCNPGNEQQRGQDIQRRLREDFESNTRAELLETTVRALRESIDKDATHAVHEQIRSKILREEIATRKDQLRQEMEAEYRDQIRQEVIDEVREEFWHELGL